MASTTRAHAPVSPAKPAPKKVSSSSTKKSPPKKQLGQTKLKVVTGAQQPKLKDFAFKSALEISPTGTILCDLDWNITFANRRTRDLLCRAETGLQAAGHSWRNFTASEIEGSHLAVLFGDEPHLFREASDLRSLPFRSMAKAGPYIWEFEISALKADSGDTQGFLVNWSDATERIAGEIRNAQLLFALDNTTSSVMLADKELRILYINGTLKKNMRKWEPEFQKAFGAGFKAEQLLNRCIDDFHKDPSHQRRLLANESIFPLSTRITVGPLRIDLSVSAVRDAEGQLTGYTTDWVDVTDRLNEEEDYKKNVHAIAERMDLLQGACSTDLAEAMAALAGGDLTVVLKPKTPLLEMPSQPDLAVMAQSFNNLRNQTVRAVEAYNEARESLSALVSETRQTSESIARSSNEVTVGNNDLAQRTEEQAASLEETASSMEEMTSTVKQNADNARQANQLALQAKESAERGGAVMSNAVSTMEEINKASKRIADIISVIDEIAFQTNLLALNAAVEAARVGEQGRGFAVVAGEVRNLAGRSATAAKEIKSLVQDSVQRVSEGSTLVNQSGKQLEEIVTSVTKVADIISEIAAAAQEQSEGIEQVNKAIIQMDQITQQNAALVEEASATSQSMNAQAEGMQELVGKFILDDQHVSPALRPEPTIRRMAHSEMVAARPLRPTPASRKTASETFEEF